MADKLLSINDAAAQGINRLRKPIWFHPFDHLKIDIFDGAPGPWTHLYAPLNKEHNGRDPIDVIVIEMDYEERCFVPYTGPMPDSDEYRAAASATVAYSVKGEKE